MLHFGGSVVCEVVGNVGSTVVLRGPCECGTFKVVFGACWTSEGGRFVGSFGTAIVCVLTISLNYQTLCDANMRDIDWDTIAVCKYHCN